MAVTRTISIPQGDLELWDELTRLVITNGEKSMSAAVVFAVRRGMENGSLKKFLS